ncbi:hypothetical protein [Sphingomonas sp. R86520]|uniref:hypothetical protein n=1 Tax=Sphingomonas sp. R86520 TaxID=3093859 RepID=UPI0036D3FBFF
MHDRPALPNLRTNSVLAAIVVMALALRVLSAGGGLWVDEAWSAEMLRHVRSPLDIVLAINHDNNHHLNGLWMWLVGYGAPPLALRAFSIATGTATVVVAAAIGSRHSVRHGIVAASLFAVSPIMVNYGSEARGYMPMLLALMTMIWLVARWLAEGDGTPGPRWRLAILAALGLFSQLTMVFGLGAIAIWATFVLERRKPTDSAGKRAIRLLLPTIAVAVAVFGVVLGAAATSPTGLQVGDYVGFSAASLWNALAVMVAASIGALTSPPWFVLTVMIGILACLACVLRRRDTIGVLYLATIVGLPVALALLRVGNTGIPRYFLLSSVGILLLLAGLLADGLGKRGATRAASAALLAIIVIACIRDDLSQAAKRRGDTGAAIATMAALRPNGATVLVEHVRPVATLRVGAAERGYRLRIVQDCPAPDFLNVDLPDGRAAPRSTIRCAVRYRLLVLRRRGVLSGVDWALYGRADLPEKYVGTPG